MTGRIFDGCWLIKYLTENILTDGHCLSPYTCKHCNAFKKFDRLNFDGLAGKRQKSQNFPPLHFCTIQHYCRVKNSWRIFFSQLIQTFQMTLVMWNMGIFVYWLSAQSTTSTLSWFSDFMMSELFMCHYNSFHDNDWWSPCHTTATLPLALCVYIAMCVQLTSTFSCCSSSSADFALHSSCNCYVEVHTYICTVRVIKFEELKFWDFIFSWHRLIT